MPPATTPVTLRHNAQAALLREIARVSRLHAERAANPILAGALNRVAAWQGRRLRQTYADLAAQERYAGAIRFFETDLYGGFDFARRDAEFARVVPVMVRMLPARVIATMADAMELNAISQELDRVLLSRLPRADGQFSVAEYSRAYRKMGNRLPRQRQIRLIAELGQALDGYVKKPVLRAALAMMRQPARMAGLGELHDFLDRGFTAFRRMGDAREFLATIAERETALMETMFAGEPAPFPDPLEPMIGAKVPGPAPLPPANPVSGPVR